MLKSILSKAADLLESASRTILEKPFASRERDTEDFVREIVKVMHAEKIELLDGTYVPDHYTLRLASTLYEHYQGFLAQCLCEQIESGIQRQLEQWNYETQTPVQVRIADGHHAEPRRIEIQHRFCDEHAARSAEYRVLHTQDPLEHFRQGRKLQSEQRFVEAIREFEAALKLSRRMAPAHFNLGSIAFQQCRYEDAVRHYKEGLEQAPDQMAAHADIAKAYEMLGEWTEAIHHLQIATMLHPDHPVIHRRLARVREEARLYSLLHQHLQTEFVADGATGPSERIRLEHFVLSCDPSLATSKRVSLEKMLESIYVELGCTFGTYPKERTEVVIRPSDPGRRQHLPSWAAASYDGRIHLVWNPQRPVELAVAYILLRHEFSHVLIAELTQGNCPSWLSEGLAELCSRKLMSSEEQMLRQAVHQGRSISLSELERGFQKLASQQIQLAYVESFHFVAYLVDRFGMPCLVRLLRQLGSRTSWRQGMHKVFDISSEELEHDWLDTIRRQQP